MTEFVKTIDGSNTLYSKKYNQYFHDLKTGAIKESLVKHVIPAFEFHEQSSNLRILDICYGLGYNTLSSIYYAKKNNLKKHIEVFSPELDLELIQSLKNFEYPEEFANLKEIIISLSDNLKYEDEFLKIELYIGDAREYIKNLKNINIVFQDAFSSEVNKELWSVEYFKDIYTSCSNDAVLTTYSISTNVRLSLFEAGFEIYEINPSGNRKQTIALKQRKEFEAKYIDMKLKMQRNKEASAIYD